MPLHPQYCVPFVVSQVRNNEMFFEGTYGSLFAKLCLDEEKKNRLISALNDVVGFVDVKNFKDGETFFKSSYSETEYPTFGHALTESILPYLKKNFTDPKKGKFAIHISCDELFKFIKVSYTNKYEVSAHNEKNELFTIRAYESATGHPTRLIVATKLKYLFIG